MHEITKPTEAFPGERSPAKGALPEPPSAAPADLPAIQIGRLIAAAAVAPRREWRGIATALRIAAALFRTRRGLSRALEGRAGTSWDGLLQAETWWLATCLTLPELRELRSRLDAGEDPETLLAWLTGIGARRFPPEMQARLLRLRQMTEACRGQFPVLPEAGPRPRPGGRSVVMAFHSAAPLVVNGYAARSEEMIRAASEAGWRPAPVLRLGYPQEIVRFRSEPDTDAMDHDGLTWRLLPDPELGLVRRSVTGYTAAYGQRLAQIAREADAPVIHAASNYLNGLAAAHAARLCGAAAVYEMRGLWHVTRAASEAGQGPGSLVHDAAEAYEMEAARRAHAVICISGALKARVTAAGVDPARVTVIPNAVSTEDFAPRPRDAALAASLGLDGTAPVIGFIGSLAAYEGGDTLLEALGVLAARGADFRVLFAGGGARRDHARKRAASLGLGRRAVFADPVPRAQVPALYSLVDIAPIARTDSEVTRLIPPIKLIEAMASGAAPVVSDLPALTEIVEPGVSGLAVPPGDAAALSAALGRLLDEPGLRDRLGAGARERAIERHSRTATVRALDELYGTLILR